MTPAYRIKHWWRACRKPGESLKAFARRYAAGDGNPNTARAWLSRKRKAR